jgi:hypothetical protein
MKIIIEAPAGRARELQLARLIATTLPKGVVLVFDPRDPRKCCEPAGPDWVICVDPEFAALPARVRCAADRVYRHEGLDRWRELQYAS